MITKEQVIEILEAALVNPNYLDYKDENDAATSYFCSSVSQVIQDKELSYDDEQKLIMYIQEKVIDPSIDDCLFLKSYLVQQGIIPTGLFYTDPVYKIAAHNHWTTLIKRLKDEA